MRYAIDHLPEPLREVAVRYYLRNEHLLTIAEDFGVTEARISQIRAQVVAALRAFFAERYDGVPVDGVDDVPGRRAREAFVSSMPAAEPAQILAYVDA